MPKTQLKNEKRERKFYLLVIWHFLFSKITQLPIKHYDVLSKFGKKKLPKAAQKKLKNVFYHTKIKLNFKNFSDGNTR